ncbi:MAG TPA: diadenylate cyclase CdaA [Candidatus Eremiobacteraceae bacterium]|nr:diadenylate cyclase CdaA [Candidatus Eremiobacteraceae bacterium]
MELPHITFGWTDVLDVVLTAYVVYVVLLLIRGTRAVQILQGIALLLVLRLIAQGLHLWTMLSIFNGLLIASGVAIPVVFQPELRRALALLGTGEFLEGRGAHHGAGTDGEVAGIVGRAAANFARGAIGAIIVIERATGLEEYVESGRVLDARISYELLLTLFAPKTPLHDGAVIVRRDRIVAAGCFLPLSEATVDRRIGTRHRAALGLTEQTDSIVLLVSEETGDIEIARAGRLTLVGKGAEDATSALLQAMAPASTAQNVSFIDRVRMLWGRADGAADRFGKTQLRP